MNKIDEKEHFIVPEGYFENFTEHMMSILPEQEFQPMKSEIVESANVAEKERIYPMWFRYIAAACVVGVLIVSAFTAFYHGTETGEQNASPMAAISTTIADSSKKVIEVVAPTSTKEQPVLAKAEILVAHDKVCRTKHVASAPVHKEKITKKVQSEHQSYDVDVNVGYNQSDVERAALYLGIDHQDMCEMMYEGI